jgi:hypothetical protein
MERLILLYAISKSVAVFFLHLQHSYLRKGVSPACHGVACFGKACINSLAPRYNLK